MTDSLEAGEGERANQNTGISAPVKRAPDPRAHGEPGNWTEKTVRVSALGEEAKLPGFDGGGAELSLMLRQGGE